MKVLNGDFTDIEPQYPIEALLEEEQPHGAEVRGQLLRGGGSVGAGTVPGAVELGELRLEDVAQAQARGVVVGHGCGD